MVHRKLDLDMDNQQPHILHIPTSTQCAEAQKIDKDSIKAHITIIAEIPKKRCSSSTQCNWGSC